VVSALSARARTLGRASLNIQDGRSALDISASTLDAVSNVLTRMVELAGQAANGSLSRTQRVSLNEEYQQLSDEVRRIANSTSFNGIELFRRSAAAGVRTDYEPVDTPATYAARGISGDGRYIAYLADTEGRIVDRLTGEEIRIVGSNTTSLAISGSGEVVYIQNNNVFKFDIETRQVSQLTNFSGGQSTTAISISADGSTIAFSSTAQLTEGQSATGAVSTVGARRLYTVSLDSGTITTSVASPLANVSSTAVSADGTKALFTFFIASPNAVALSVGDDSAAAFSMGFTVDGYNAIMNDGSVLYSGAGLYRRDISGNVTTIVQNVSSNFFTLSNDQSTLIFASADNLSGDALGVGKRILSLDLNTGVYTTVSHQALDSSVEDILNARWLASSSGSLIVGSPSHVVTTGLSVWDYSSASSQIRLSVGDNRAEGITVTLASLLAQIDGLGGYLLTTQGSAQGALSSMRDSILALAEVKGTIGAALARLGSAQSVVDTQILEFRAAEGRIADADIASESATLTRSRILQDASAAVLAQANLQPSLALLLLTDR
jgi:flagellin